MPTDRSDIVQYHKMFIPTLEALESLGCSVNIDELNARVIQIMELPEEMCNVLHKDDGTQTEFDYRLAWARTYLKKARSY